MMRHAWHGKLRRTRTGENCLESGLTSREQDFPLVNNRVFKPTAKMTKRTKKVGITGKYGTRYGASLRKQVRLDQDP